MRTYKPIQGGGRDEVNEEPALSIVLEDLKLARDHNSINDNQGTQVDENVEDEEELSEAKSRSRQ